MNLNKCTFCGGSGYHPSGDICRICDSLGVVRVLTDEPRSSEPADKTSVSSKKQRVEAMLNSMIRGRGCISGSKSALVNDAIELIDLIDERAK